MVHGIIQYDTKNKQYVTKYKTICYKVKYNRIQSIIQYDTKYITILYKVKYNIIQSVIQYNNKYKTIC